MQSRYAIPAFETEEGKKREHDYHAALGRFVAMFAIAETAIQLTLWHYAKTPAPVARSVFSGVRTNEGINFVKRIVEATGVEAEAKIELEYVTQQLGIINGARNSILHHGALSVAEGRGIVPNALVALTPEKITAFPISPQILDDMTNDLRKIIVHLHAHHMGRPPPRGNWLDPVLRSTWRYKHREQRQGSNKGSAKSQQSSKRAPKRSRQP